MASAMIPIVYREFYDLPRDISLEVEGLAYFLLCPFDEAKDGYADFYEVYRLSPSVHACLSDPDSDWLGAAKSGQFVGQAPVDALRFDESRRAAVEERSLRAVLEALSEEPKI